MDLWIIITTSALLLIGILFTAYMIFGRSNKNKTIYMVGLSGSGKTKLFYNVCVNKSYPTITSQVKNEFQLDVGKKKVQFVDLPGHPRIRTEVLAAIKNADAIIFTIDSETVLRVINDIANFLYDILCVPEIYTKRIPIMILSTKNDIPGSRSIDIIKSELEREIDDIRANRQQSNFVENNENIFIGEQGKEFEFSQLNNNVQFATCSVVHEDISEVLKFIQENA
ncbi:Signal recognition particle receptor subunit beta [Histomonas meleagridis]|uniref:Signal recognition particle receptor subunit beta n=1 Tax=Histomonas meleagridis TaxID=135588 RepID=UPI00355A5C17|nr:Signal recognition particle receptor subunit beta [Histomonas meleagridis]KAH0799737.1 Signal recognition particle receptor subunit beta [Histomonas meleagridis]